MRVLRTGQAKYCIGWRCHATMVFNNHTFERHGAIVKVIEAYSSATPDDVITFFGIDSTDKRWNNLVNRPARVDRVVIQKDNGDYCIIPDTYRAIFTVEEPS